MKRSKYSAEFHKVFGLPLERFTGSLTHLLGKFDFDVVRFDGWCKTQGYIEDGKTSCADFVQCKWGKSAEALIMRILGERS